MYPLKIRQAWDGGLQNCINAKLKYTSLDAILDFLLKFNYSLIKFNHVVALMNVEKIVLFDRLKNYTSVLPLF